MSWKLYSVKKIWILLSLESLNIGTNSSNKCEIILLWQAWLHLVDLVWRFPFIALDLPLSQPLLHFSKHNVTWLISFSLPREFNKKINIYKLKLKSDQLILASYQFERNSRAPKVGPAKKKIVSGQLKHQIDLWNTSNWLNSNSSI